MKAEAFGVVFVSKLELGNERKKLLAPIGH